MFDVLVSDFWNHWRGGGGYKADRDILRLAVCAYRKAFGWLSSGGFPSAVLARLEDLVNQGTFYSAEPWPRCDIQAETFWLEGVILLNADIVDRTQIVTLGAIMIHEESHYHWYGKLGPRGHFLTDLPGDATGTLREQDALDIYGRATRWVWRQEFCRRPDGTLFWHRVTYWDRALAECGYRTDMLKLCGGRGRPTWYPW